VGIAAKKEELAVFSSKTLGELLLLLKPFSGNRAGRTGNWRHVIDSCSMVAFTNHQEKNAH
jgi:hypothetical protein